MTIRKCSSKLTILPSVVRSGWSRRSRSFVSNTPEFKIVRTWENTIQQNVPSNVNLGIWWGKLLVTTSNCRRVNQVCLIQYPRVALLSTDRARLWRLNTRAKRWFRLYPWSGKIHWDHWVSLTPNTYGPQLSLDATIQSPVKNVAFIL